MLVKGDKIVLVKPMGALTNVGEVCEVISNVDGVINFKFGHGMHMGCMSFDEFEKYFEKYEEPTEAFEKGDRVRIIKDAVFLSPMKAGDEFIIQDIIYGVATLSSENEGRPCYVAEAALKEYFTKVVTVEESEEIDEPISVSSEYIDKILDNSHISVSTIFDKCTVVACKLPSGFVIVESSACIDPRNYNEKLGVEICMKHIKDRVWEMEAYKIQTELWEDKITFEDEDDIDKEEYCSRVEKCSDCKICMDNGGQCHECDEDEDLDDFDEDDDCVDCESCPVKDSCHP